jgi:arylsulfatase
MTKRFKGKIALDVRDAVNDWEPYLAPRAPEGAPNVLYIVWDDVGFGALEPFGGLIQVPNMKRIADAGLRYTQFHTTALCSPSRSCFLTGRNATSNGMACITEGANGFPGFNGRVPFENAMLPEVLVERGWATMALGKWHLTPTDEESLAGTRIRWPLGRGFERFYGFLGAETDQWYPDLTYDNHMVDPPATPAEGYHLSKDLADKALEFLADVRAADARKPWMMYFAPGAGHAPHHVWPEWADKYKGKFDMGYEKYRELVLANMKKLGLVPANTELPALNPYADERGPDGKPWPEGETVRPWGSLSKDEQRLFARMAEVYAGFISYTDFQIGRILDFLENTKQLENTIIVVVSDNGASGEGGPNGSVNENKFFNGVADTIEANMKHLGDLGTEATYNHYPTGWCMAFNTPFKLWKRYASHQGGTSDPMIISWPKGIKARGEVRDQYAHAIDIVPTLYECLGITPPEAVKGVTQREIEGVSFRHTFDDAKAPTAKVAQFYTMLGTRGLWMDGWQANTVHAPCPSDWGHFEEDRWELFNIQEDRAQLNDLAAKFPEKLERLKATWYVLAGKYQGLPLDDRSAVEILRDSTPTGVRPGKQGMYFGGASPVPEAVAVEIAGRSFNFVTEVALDDAKAEGVLFSMGGRFGGHVLYLQDGKLHYVYNWLGDLIQPVEAKVELKPGKHFLGVRYSIQGKDGTSPTGLVELFLNDQAVGKGRIKSQPSNFGLDSKLVVGRSLVPAVTKAITAPFAFKGGRVLGLVVDASGEPYRDLERQLAGIMMRE